MKIFEDKFLSTVYGIDVILKNDDIDSSDDINSTEVKDSANQLISSKFSGDKDEFLKSLFNEVSACKSCILHTTRTNIVFGEGNINSKLMFIGEGPGADEDEKGRPFIGRAGQLLTKMIEAMKLSRDDVYIANIVKCRPPNNRNPFEEEAKSCIKYLEAQIKAINPNYIVTLGSVAGKYLLGDLGTISSFRGKWFNYGEHKVMPTFHPAYLLRSPDKKKDAWADLQLVMKEMGLL